jgi:hypothetical protein
MEEWEIFKSKKAQYTLCEARDSLRQAIKEQEELAESVISEDDT